MTSEHEFDEDSDPEIAQMAFFGEPFNRKLETGIERQEGPSQTRRVGIIATQRPDGTTAFYPTRDVNNIIPSDLHQGTLEEAEHLEDPAETSRPLSTARRDGASTPHVDTETKFKERGGTGKVPLKKGGFGSITEEEEIRRIGKQRSRDVRTRQRKRG